MGEMMPAAIPLQGHSAPETELAVSHPFALYACYGLRLKTDVPVPLTPISMPAAAGWDWEAHVAPVGQPAPEPDGRAVAGLPCTCPEHGGRMVTLVYRGPGGAWFWHEKVGTFHVHPDCRHVDVYPERGGDVCALALTLIGQVAVFVLHQLGRPSLHAGAVVQDGEAIVFLGLPGQGKSTLTSFFLQRGAELLTDDVLPLRNDPAAGIVGIPSLPSMKVWPQTADHALRLDHSLPVVARGVEKRLYTLEGRHRFASEPARIGAIYLLRRYDPKVTKDATITVQELGSQEGLKVLLMQTSNRAYLRPAENASLVPIYARLLSQSPVRLLSYPTGFAYQDEVRGQILRDVTAP
jgi:hypothetical protein